MNERCGVKLSEQRGVLQDQVTVVPYPFSDVTSWKGTEERCVIRHGPVETRQGPQALYKPCRLPRRQSEKHLD